MPHGQNAALRTEINRGLVGEVSWKWKEWGSRSSCSGMLADGREGSCWNLPKGLCLKKKKSHFPIHPQRQRGRDEDWHDCSVHTGERFCCCVWCEAVWTQTHSGICVLCLSLTDCNSGIKGKNFIAADRDFFFCVCAANNFLANAFSAALLNNCPRVIVLVII